MEGFRQSLKYLLHFSSKIFGKRMVKSNRISGGIPTFWELCCFGSLCGLECLLCFFADNTRRKYSLIEIQFSLRRGSSQIGTRLHRLYVSGSEIACAIPRWICLLEIADACVIVGG